jgi:hypothetical protein
MKKALALLFALCLITSSVGCSGEDADDDTTTESTTTSTETE